MGALLSFLFGAAHATQLSFAAKPAHVELASARAGADATTRTVSLEELVAQRCPSLRTPFEPVWWLPKCVWLSVWVGWWLMAWEVGIFRRRIRRWGGWGGWTRLCLDGACRRAMLAETCLISGSERFYERWMGARCELSRLFSGLLAHRMHRHRGLDFAHPMTSHAVPDDTPIIVILSGLTGGAFALRHIHPSPST